jgi:hypothetical protein
MNSAAAPLSRPDDSAESGAEIIPIKSARKKTASALQESPDISPDKIQGFLDAVRMLDEEITRDDYRESCEAAAEIMDQYVKQGLLAKNEKGFYQASQGYEDDGEKLIATFVTILSELKKRKTKVAPQVAKQPVQTMEKPKSKLAVVRPEETYKPSSAPAKSEKREAYPLAIEMDGKTFSTPGEALAYSNKLGKGAEAFRTRYYALLESGLQMINKLIDGAIKEIAESKRFVTKDDQKGILEIMSLFEKEGIVRRNTSGSYRPNPDIEMAAKLTTATNERMKAISEHIEQEKAAFHEREARREAYETILKSENGFEQAITNQRGKEVARFAYQIRLEEKLGKRIIIVDKVVAKFGNPSLQEGNEFIYADKSIPSQLKFLNAAAYQLMQKRTDAQRQHPLGTLADVANGKNEGKKK